MIHLLPEPCKDSELLEITLLISYLASFFVIQVNSLDLLDKISSKWERVDSTLSALHAMTIR
jgi:hypothetical protein